MSTAADDRSASVRRKRAVASVAFIGLLLLSVSWPMPVVLLNEATFDTALPLHDKSFLGREAPSWDVVFWCLAGLYALAVIHFRADDARRSSRDFVNDIRTAGPRMAAALRDLRPVRVFSVLLAGAVLTGLIWLFVDAWLYLEGDGLRVEWPRQVVRHLNRLGGGMNPGMIVAFFALVGIAFSQPRWPRYAIAMAGGGLVAGIAVQILKLFVNRARPELWYGPFFFADSTSTSFPSGHTAGAFALAGVLVFGSPSIAVRLAAFAIAGGIGLSRVIVFRHWPSDVVAAAMIGLFFAWFFTRATVHEGKNGAGTAAG